MRGRALLRAQHAQRWTASIGGACGTLTLVAFVVAGVAFAFRRQIAATPEGVSIAVAVLAAVATLGLAGVLVANGWVPMHVLGAWDELLIQLFSHRRHVANFRAWWDRAHVLGREPCPTIIGKPEETGEGIEFILAPPSGVYDSAWLQNREIELQDQVGFGCLNVRMARLSRGGQVICTIVMRDPFRSMHLDVTPIAHEHTWDIRHPLTVGRNVRDKAVDLAVHNRNGMIIGQPGMGKTTAQSAIVAAAVLSYNARLVYVDLKGNIAGRIWHRLAYLSARTPEDAHELFRALEVEMNDDLVRVGEADVDELDPTAEWPATIIVIDEITDLTPETQQIVRRIAQMGRAACYVVHWATQRSHHKVVDTTLRSVTHWAMCFGVKTEDDSDAALGKGMAGRGYNASKIDTPGEFFFVGAASDPLRCKAYDFPRDARRAVAERAAGDGGSDPGSSPGRSTPDDLQPCTQSPPEVDRVDRPTWAAPQGPSRPAPGPPGLDGKPGKQKVWRALIDNPDGYRFKALVLASGTSNQTVADALGEWDGRWVRKGHDSVWVAVTDVADVA